MLQLYKFGLQVHENTTSIKSLHFQVDEDLVCMNMVSTFHYIIIIYQSFNVKIY